MSMKEDEIIAEKFDKKREFIKMLDFIGERTILELGLNAYKNYNKISLSELLKINYLIARYKKRQ